MLKYFLLAASLAATPAHAEMRQYRVLTGGRDVGHLKADFTAERVVIDYDYKNNGRGPTIAEVIALDRDGYPVRWDIDGATTFGKPDGPLPAITGRSAPNARLVYLQLDYPAR